MITRDRVQKWLEEGSELVDGLDAQRSMHLDEIRKIDSILAMLAQKPRELERPEKTDSPPKPNGTPITTAAPIDSAALMRPPDAQSAESASAAYRKQIVDVVREMAPQALRRGEIVALLSPPIPLSHVKNALRVLMTTGELKVKKLNSRTYIYSIPPQTVDEFTEAGGTVSVLPEAVTDEKPKPTVRETTRGGRRYGGRKGRRRR